jgi:hypothetical protein
MSSRPEKKKACSAAPKKKNRPYDNRPRSGSGRTAQGTPRDEEAIRVVLPDEPPRLTPGAAAALLRILLKANAKLDGNHDPRGTAQ